MKRFLVPKFRPFGLGSAAARQDPPDLRQARMNGAGHVLVFDQLDGDCLDRLKQSLLRVGVQLALASRKGRPAIHLGVCRVSAGSSDGKIAQVQVGVRPALG